MADQPSHNGPSGRPASGPGEQQPVEALSRAHRRRARRQARWPDPTPSSREWSVRYALLAFLSIAIVGVLLYVALRFGVGIHHTGLSALSYDLISSVFSCLACVAALLPLYRAGRLSSPRDLGLRAVPSARSVSLVALAVVAVYVLGELLSLVFVLPSTKAAVGHYGAIEIVLFGFMAAVLLPVTAEIFLRGLVYRAFRNRMGTMPAATLLAVMYVLSAAAGDPDLGSLLYRAGLQFVLCLLYQRTGSLLPGITLQSFFGAALLEEALSGKQAITILAFVSLALGLLSRAGILSVKRRVTRRAGRHANAG